jgi:arginyl-tRNA synthetase
MTLKVGNPERILIKNMAQYPIIVKEAGDNYSPALLANYTFELVKSFNNFYQNVSILNEADENIKNTRLLICNEIAKIIASSMELLGIKVPEKM